MARGKSFPVDIGLMQAVASMESADSVGDQAEKVIHNCGLTGVDLVYILLAHELTRPRVIVRVVSDDVAVKEALN